MSAYLAAENPEDVYAQILFSPNIEIADNASELLTAPWGRQLAHAVNGKVHSFVPPPGAEQYWTTAYATDGLICLKYLVEETMTPKTWQKIKQPTFMGYYFKNEEECDHVVSLDAMQDFFEKIGTPAANNREVAFPDGSHCLVSAFHIQDLEPMKKEVFAFCEEVLGLQPVSE